MRASELTLAVCLIAGCGLNDLLDDLAQYPLTSSTSETSTGTSEGSSGASLSGEGPIQTNTGPEPTVGEPEVLDIESIAVATQVLATGPLRVDVVTRRATAVELRLDDLPLGPMQPDGDDAWTYTLVIDSRTADGQHALEVRASDDSDTVTRAVSFTVTKPATGTVAWSEAIEAPPGTTNALAFAADGDILEGGGTLANGAMRPSLRKRQISSGAMAWPEGTRVLWADRVGEVAALATAADGTLWVAANVGTVADLPTRPRIVHLDASGEPLGPYMEAVTGQSVRDLVVDPVSGGCIAVGSTPAGDRTDGKLWYLDADGAVTFAPAWKYEPELDPDYYDAVFESLAIVGDEVIAGGHVFGLHADNLIMETTRSVVLRVARDNGEPLATPWIAPVDGIFTQSWVRALVPDTQDGWIAVGEACDNDCLERRLEVSRFSSIGTRIDLVRDELQSWGNSAATDSQGHAVSASALETNGLDARLLTHDTSTGNMLLEVSYPTNAESVEEALAVAVDIYDRIVYAGYVIGADMQKHPIIERVHR